MSDYKIKLYREDKEWRWRISSVQNGKIVGASTEGYFNRAECIENFHLVTGIWITMDFDADSYTWVFKGRKMSGPTLVARLHFPSDHDVDEI